MVGRDRISGVFRHFRDGEYWCPVHRLMGLGPPDQDLKTWRSHEDVLPHVCHEGSNCAAEGGTRLDCLSMTKNPKVRHTHKAGSRSPRLVVMVQR